MLLMVLTLAMQKNIVVLGLSSPVPAPQQQLTWQELGTTLVTMRANGVPEDVLRGTRLPSLQLSRCRVSDSKVSSGGRGLFATMDCKQGDLLTCYPGDVLMRQTGFTPKNPKQDFGLDDATLRDYLQRYCIGLTEDTAIMGLPTLDQDMAYAGHFINDGVQQPPTIETELPNYYVESQKAANAEFIPLENLHMATIATRDIVKEEEIFVFYGPEYWMDHTSTWKGSTS